MGLLQSYAIWNNKGGVGKSTLTFHLASRYAELNPKTNVLVIDLCPQSNASMLLLGGGTDGEKCVLDHCTLTTPKTIVGYLSSVIASGPGAQLPNPHEFVIRASDHNRNIPSNCFLLCGDGNLEPMSPAISSAAAAPPLTPSSNPWKWVHEIVRNLINNISHGSSSDWMVFVDTNPSFSIYTEIAVSSVDRLITPVNADDSSRVATNAMFILLHGAHPPHPIYGSWTYAAKAHSSGIHVPKIHLVVGNRLTQYGGAATAFEAMSDATTDTLFGAFLKHPSFFTDRTKVPATIDDFRREYSEPLRDFNTAGVVAAHLGQMLSQMKDGHYSVHGTEVDVKRDRVRECTQAIDKIVARLK